MDHNNYIIQSFTRPSEIPGIGTGDYGTFKKEYNTPRDIKLHLDRYVIGQDEAKKVLATAIYNRDIRLLSSKGNEGRHIDKSNILMLGPTGSGKTYLLEVLSEFLSVPYVIEDATVFTEAGYVGTDVLDILDRLLLAASRKIMHEVDEPWPTYTARVKELAESGIVYIDEIDKISSKNGLGVSTSSVQEELLKMVEGSTVVLDSVRSNSRGKTTAETLDIKTLNTRNILFIVGGSFHGLEKIVESRTNDGGIGFTSKVQSKEEKVKNVFHEVTTEDLIQFGLIPEFLGRFHIHVALDHLTQEDLVKILSGPENNVLEQYTIIFKYSGRELVFTEEALIKVAELATKAKTGARGLKKIVERTLRDIMFEAPDDKYGPMIEITEADVKGC